MRKVISIVILLNAMEFAVCHYHNDFLICIKSKIALDLFLVEGVGKCRMRISMLNAMPHMSHLT